jgi:hypothetical protein
VRQILFEEVCESATVKERCERYATEGGFRNLDHFLDALVFDKEFRALVIIDEETDDLHTVIRNLGFPVEVIEFSTYVNDKGERIHRFEPFLADVEAVDIETRSESVVEIRPRDPSDLDTIVVPAREVGFRRVFLSENRWWAVRIHPTMAKQLKYIAAYLTAPKSAITHYASIHSIEPWQNTGKVVINFEEPAKEISPLKLIKNGRIAPLYGLRYTKFEKLQNAKSLDDVF